MEKEKYFILEGVSSVLFILISQGAVFTGLAVLFKLDEFKLGIAASFPLIAQILQIFTPYFVEKFGNRKLLTNLFNLSGRILWSLFIIFSITFKWYRSSEFITIFAISQILTSMAANIWMSWARDLTPSEIRGKIFGKRNLYVSLSTLATFYVYSELIDNLHKFGYTITAILGFLGAFLSFYYMNKLPNAPIKRVGALAALRVVFQDKNFIKLSVFYSFWNFATMFTSPFFMYHLIKNLHVSFRYISIYTIISSLIAMAFYRFFGNVSDEVGHKSVAQFGISLVSITPILWILMNSKTYHYMLLVDATITGIGWSAINLSMVTLPMEVATGTQSAYFSVYTSFGGIGGLVGSLLGGISGKFLSNYQWQHFGMEFYGLQLVFVIGGILRFLSLFLLKKVEVKKNIPLGRYTFNTLVVVFRRIPFKLQEGVYTLRRGFRKDKGGQK